jgi:hypothetical protein
MIKLLIIHLILKLIYHILTQIPKLNNLIYLKLTIYILKKQ